MNAPDHILTAALTDSLTKASKQLSLDISRDLAQLQKLGGLRFMQNLLKRGLESPAFSKLAEKGLLKLSCEAVCIRAEFGQLFNDDEINLCFERLCENGYRF